MSATPKRGPACVWKEGDAGIWTTGCGGGFASGALPKLSMRYCPYCGKRLVVVDCVVTSKKQAVAAIRSAMYDNGKELLVIEWIRPSGTSRFTLRPAYNAITAEFSRKHYNTIANRLNRLSLTNCK